MKRKLVSLFLSLSLMVVRMKDKLTSMSKKVDEKIEDTTEEDAKQAITELKRLETNLQQTKKNVEAHIAK